MSGNHGSPGRAEGSQRNPGPCTGNPARCVGLILTAAFLAIVLAACRGETPAYTARFSAFDTFVDLTIVGVNPKRAKQISQALQQAFAFMEGAWSPDRPGPLRRVNELLRTGKAFAAPPSVLPLIRTGRIYAEKSENLFNPAIGQLLDLWGFASNSPQMHAPPTRRRIEALVAAHPRMSDIRVDGIQVRCDNPAVALDFGAFATGYGIDVAIEHLRDFGIRNAMVRAGGNLRVIGDRAGRPWLIPIRRASGGGVIATIGVSGDESLFTVTDHDKTFVYDGKIYHNNIDPRTGYPARGSRSATAISSSAAAATAAAHALFIAGPVGWYRIAEDMQIPYVLLIDSEDKVHMNPAMADRVEILDKGVPIELSAPLIQHRRRRG